MGNLASFPGRRDSGRVVIEAQEVFCVVQTRPRKPYRDLLQSSLSEDLYEHDIVSYCSIEYIDTDFAPSQGLPSRQCQDIPIDPARTCSRSQSTCANHDSPLNQQSVVYEWEL